MKYRSIVSLITFVFVVFADVPEGTTDSAIVFNPRPDDISLLKIAPPQYKFYIQTNKESNAALGVMNLKYQLDEAKKSSSSSKDGEKGSKARNEAADRQRDGQKATKSLD